MIQTSYNPDVLSCLANLSNDEVFTPPNLVNDILDLLPQEIWSNPNAKFLDPVSKSGVFLREMAKRLMHGLEIQIPGKQERINHIFKNQLYGIAITELTSLLSRRSVYCSKTANGKYSICETFEDEQGNIRYERMQHTWQNGKCSYCGASQKEYDRDEILETYAYHFIHTDKPEKIFNMKFDVIVGNPPYQLSDGGGTGDSAKPIYHLFIQQAKKLNPKYLTMIIPSRWMKGGKGLDSFRQEMMKDERLSHLFDFANANKIFPGIHLDGGVCYFLWEQAHKGVLENYYTDLNNKVVHSTRLLRSEFSETIIRDIRQESIISKVYEMSNSTFSNIVYARKPFGISADFFNDPQKYTNMEYSENPKDGLCKIFGVKGIKGGAKRVHGFIDRNEIMQNKESIDKYKLFFSKAYMTTSTNPPKIILAKPNEICTETFLQIGFFETAKEAENCLEYLNTNFSRALLFFNRSSLNISQETFVFIPMQDFNESWTDKKLYKKYGLTEEEIGFIESMIRPMEINTKEENKIDKI
ncbi:Eco57I restriction-modification methylase [Bacteroidales bacterium Barb4]|nr:Eco57I restriction-modification methylase [Bacteroidales bacterium Barb4]